MYQTRTAKPRKIPQQKRSKETVSAIREATLELLLRGDDLPFTTNEVAARAGVSIGTLYQYFTDRSGLFQEVFRHQFLTITESVEAACVDGEALDIEEMSQKLVIAFMGTALKNLPLALAQHAVVDLAVFREIVPPFRERQERAIAKMLASLGSINHETAQTAARVIFASLAGNTRSLLDRSADEAEVKRAVRAVETMTTTYMRQCLQERLSTRHSAGPTKASSIS